MASRCLGSMVVILGALASHAWSADVFDRHTMAELRQAVDQGTPAAQITLADVAKIKPLGKNLSSPCVAVKTNNGNYAKALLGWGLRKGGEKPTPVVVLERYVTYRIDRPELTSAAGKDVMLFPGFGFNFDIGQVVPVGHGADVEFTAEGALKPVGDAVISPINGSMLPAPTETAKHDPNDHEGVLPADFAGTWLVDADGRWKGEWELKVDASGRIDGTFISDELQNRYEMLGQIGSTPQHLKLTVTLANAQMNVDAYLWTTDKSKMAGTVDLVGRKFGFVATRVAESE
ncbi:hypothetical protein GC163_23395 [bacterium]|nr:hypothetical protein [bacterium]